MNEKENIRKLSEWFTKTLGFRVEVGPALEGGTVNSTRSSVMLVTHSTPRKYRLVPGNELEAITSAGADAVRLIDRLKTELTTGMPTGHKKPHVNANAPLDLATALKDLLAQLRKFTLEGDTRVYRIKAATGVALMDAGHAALKRHEKAAS